MNKKFEAKMGNLTNIIRYDYIKTLIEKNLLPNNSLENKEIIRLYANNDKNKPLYFWQLYSIIGEDIIEKLIRIFYTKIFNDTKNKWFSEEFIELGSIEYHVKGQKKFWLDVMGGGVYYIGGLKKLNMRHKLVKNIMTKKGGDLWMYYMIESLKEIKNDIDFDKRILVCIVDFLHYFMMKYGYEFDFNFTNLRNSNL